MRWRWYYFKRALRDNRPLLAVFFSAAAISLLLWNCRHGLTEQISLVFHMYGVQAAGKTMEGLWPALAGKDEAPFLAGWLKKKSLLYSFLEQMEEPEFSEDPAYERLLAKAWENRIQGSGKGSGAGGSGAGNTGQNGTAGEQGIAGQTAGEAENKSLAEGVQGSAVQDTAQDTAATGLVGENIASKASGQTLIFEKLADYDYLMKSFYSVHPTTTAGRDLMNAEKFLNMDFSLEKKAEPQILIYHTHSQEEFADYPENPEATIVGVGTYLTELLESKGYQVIHDTGAYDLHDGKLDRNKAYTYALDGISGILQRNPSIEVVLDIHRDGVKEGVRLVKEINGKPTAQIMFFNGTSQTPDGPIEYLPNPNRDFNLGFSFQMQLKAAEDYPGYTRKIYLKGLRYNEHVRARAALIEVGAQTNTYEEARNAMEPLADILDQVLGGE